MMESGCEEQDRDMEEKLGDNTLRLVIEAVLFVATSPVSHEQLTGLFGPSVSKEDVKCAISSLWEKYEKDESSLQIVEIAGGFKMTTRPHYAGWIEKFFTRRRKVSLTKASLEVLSIIAYQQPVTIAQVDHVRGVDSAGVVRGLLKHNLIAIKGRKKAPGRPILLATTDKFLDHFGLSSLDELPRPEEVAGGARLESQQEGEIPFVELT
ncbi:MAG: SMC-Scp complex subunit ScpB, partial [Candidatus Coatesbacteria bacterium]|nr:SMC-Scp complex subunit ScpB [Candidatus Coatesbacteria bacterium]